MCVLSGRADITRLELRPKDAITFHEHECCEIWKLVLAGAILGVKTSYDAKFVRIDAELRKKADKPEIE